MPSTSYARARTGGAGHDVVVVDRRRELPEGLDHGVLADARRARDDHEDRAGGAGNGVADDRRLTLVGRHRGSTRSAVRTSSSSAGRAASARISGRSRVT